jgi:formate/nitrite transporter FocA (FNT family)
MFGEFLHNSVLSGPSYFTLAMLLAGIFSQNIVCRALTAIWVVTYVVNVGVILMEFMWKYANTLKAR